MNRPRSEKPAGNDSAIEDPAFIEAALRALFETEAEFPIKVEGTSTLPYASVIQEIRGNTELLVLKLIRPLPHELMNGALFQVIFPCEDKRYQARITFQGREGYLQYRFTPPVALTHADRRIAKRFPFRPRENAYVIAQDGRIPALGVAGPLVNIGLGGFAMRVDRVLKLDDGMRVPPSTALFDRDRIFPRVRIQDLPRLPLLEWRGTVTHATARGDEVILGFSFGELTEDEVRSLGDCLNFREKLMRGAGHPANRSDSGLPVAPSGEPRKEIRMDRPSPQEVSDETAGSHALSRLQRRSTRVLLCMAEGEMRGKVQAHLAAQGLVRIECLANLAELKPQIQARAGQPAAAWVLLDLALAGGGDVEPLAAMRTLERELGDLGALPVAILCERVDPTLFLVLDAHLRVLPYQPADAEEEQAWDMALQTFNVS